MLNNDALYQELRKLRSVAYMAQDKYFVVPNYHTEARDKYSDVPNLAWLIMASHGTFSYYFDAQEFRDGGFTQYRIYTLNPETDEVIDVTNSGNPENEGE